MTTMEPQRSVRERGRLSCCGDTVLARAPGCFRWDRYWLVVRLDGRFLTQRQVPRCERGPPGRRVRARAAGCGSQTPRSAPAAQPGAHPQPDWRARPGVSNRVTSLQGN